MKLYHAASFRQPLDYAPLSNKEVLLSALRAAKPGNEDPLNTIASLPLTTSQIATNGLKIEAVTNRSHNLFSALLSQLADGLVSNRSMLIGALFGAASSIIILQLLALRELPSAGESISLQTFIALQWLSPALLFSHTASRGMGQLALTNRLLLFASPFALSMILTLLVSSQTQPIFLSLLIALGGFSILGWYSIAGLIIARYRPFRFGVICDESDDLVEAGQGLFKRLEPKNRLDGHAAIIVGAQTRGCTQYQRMVQRAALEGVPTISWATFLEWKTGRTPLESLETLISLSGAQIFYLKVKKFVDLFFAIVVFPVIVCILCVSSVAIRLESPGHIIFRQVRIGRRGKAFVCYKLRTMRVDMPGAVFTGEDDPRITRTGRLLRRWRIDELPQILNIIRGEMSWIGPRPEAAPLAMEYRRRIAHYGYRYMVPPGITGWAAVHQGNVGEVQAARVKLEYDFYYIRHLSFWLDLLIAFKTVRTIVTGFGSR